MKLKNIFLKGWRWTEVTIVSIAIIIGFLALVGIAGTFIKSNTALNINNLPSKDGNLFKVCSGLDSDFMSHYLFIKNLSIPVDTTTYLDLLSTCLFYMDTVPLWNVKPLPVKKIVILKSLDGFVEMSGHDNQDWEEIGNNEIVVIQRKENSILDTRYKKDDKWEHVDYKIFKNNQGGYIFENIK